MAPLKVIGAGFSRTGTESLRNALNRLGYHTMHLHELFDKDQGSLPMDFLDVYRNPEKPVNWDELYKDYDAAVDVPTYLLLDRLLKVYPDAKVILTERDVDSWYQSFHRTIIQTLGTVSEDAPQHVKDTQDMAVETCFDGVPFTGKEIDEEAFKAKYLKHYEWVKMNVPPERLLVFRQGEANYPELCAFLGIQEVPEEPYPWTNRSQDMATYLKGVFQS